MNQREQFDRWVSGLDMKTMCNLSPKNIAWAAWQESHRLTLEHVQSLTKPATLPGALVLPADFFNRK